MVARRRGRGRGRRKHERSRIKTIDEKGRWWLGSLVSQRQRACFLRVSSTPRIRSLSTLRESILHICGSTHEKQSFLPFLLPVLDFSALVSRTARSMIKKKEKRKHTKLYARASTSRGTVSACCRCWRRCGWCYCIAYLPVIGDPADVHGLHTAGLVRLDHLRHAVLGHLHHKADLFLEGARIGTRVKASQKRGSVRPPVFVFRSLLFHFSGSVLCVPT